MTESNSDISPAVVRQMDRLVNDGEINYLADLFLSGYGFDRASSDYRLVKNAVILISHDAWPMNTVYGYIAKNEGLTKDLALRHLRKLLGRTDRPIHELFNSRYAKIKSARGTLPHMKAEDSLDYILGFLGGVFLYIIVSYYDKYDLIQTT